MKTLFKTSDVIKFLYTYECIVTAEDIRKRANGAEFIDSKLIKRNLIKPIYKVLTETLNQHTYAK